ncbi:VOC family protein [Nocardioides jensenii]|uniref:VOC family protein n=1 Tax=Nocardioides jensenii TaxID=1843 RepID=UPI0008333FE4|nr:VOC family protein [Nocardioides jensenii]
MTGRVVHFEIPYGESDRAKAFYAEAFGWELLDIPEMSYTLATTGPSGETGPTEPGFVNGGLMRRESPTEGPIIVIDVPDIDVALAKIESLGGSTVLGKQAVGDMGFAAYFKDVEGNIMGLWQSA